MTIFNSHMFFLGNFADMDTNEANFDTENAADILGSYSKPPLIAVVVDDTNSDSGISDEDNGGVTSEDFTYDTGSGSTSQLLDSTQTYMADVLLGDGTTSNIQVTVIQLKNGDVFLTDFANNGSLDNLNVQSVELLSITGSDYTGFFADSSVDGSAIVCFASGTLIETDRGLIPVEKLHPGHHVRTLDHGYRPIRWVGHRTLGHSELNANPRLRPIVIRKRALGNTRRMLVSPQHGFLIDGHFIRAKHLAQFWGGQVARVDKKCESITYVHFFCDQHEIVFAEGAATESLYPGPNALQVLGQKAVSELVLLLPELAKVINGQKAVEKTYGSPARRYMTGGEIRRKNMTQKYPREMTSIATNIPADVIATTQHHNTELVPEF